MTNLARTQSISSLSSNTPLKPIKVRVPGFVLRGAGFNTHIDYEVKVGGHFAYVCSNEFVTIFLSVVFLSSYQLDVQGTRAWIMFE